MQVHSFIDSFIHAVTCFEVRAKVFTITQLAFQTIVVYIDVAMTSDAALHSKLSHKLHTTLVYVAYYIKIFLLTTSLRTVNITSLTRCESLDIYSTVGLFVVVAITCSVAFLTNNSCIIIIINVGFYVYVLSLPNIVTNVRLSCLK